MSSSNNRFGRRTARQNDDLRAEPVLSFNPKRPAARDAQSEPAPPAGRKPQAGPRVEREDAEEFGMSSGRDGGPRIERDDAFDPRVRREKALEQRVPESERPLYHHLFDEQENRRRGFGWIAALGSVAVVAIGAAYAWHNFMARPAPANLFEPPGFTTRNNGTGYVTPTQPTTDAGAGTDTGSTASPLAATPPASPDQQSTRDVTAAPAPKSVPAEAPPPPKKTISEAAANPGSLGPPASPAPTPPATKQPAAAPAPILTPPPKHEAAKPETAKTPRKEASVTPPKPAPAPAPQDAAPPAVMQPAAAPAVTAPPPRQFAPQAPASRAPASQAPGSQATGQPQQLNGNAPAAYAPPSRQQAPQQQPQLGNAGPPPNASDAVTVDGTTYVNGQEPRALGTLAGPPQAAYSDAPMPPGVPAMPAQSASPGYSTRSYAPADHDGGAPLPNDVIILPNGQMAVPNGQR
jgi:hypothetical protein